MVDFVWTGSAAPLGQTPSVSNSGGASGPAMNQVNVTSPETAVYTDFSSLPNTAQIAFTYTATGAACRCWWAASGTGRLVIDAIVQLDNTVTTGAEDIMYIRNTGNTNMAGAILNSETKLTVLNAASSGTGMQKSTNVFPIDTAVRVSLAVTPGTTTTNGRIEVAYWTSITASTPTWEWDSGNTVNTGTTATNSFYIGRSTTRAQATKAYYNIIRAKHVASGWLAPYVTPNTAPVISSLLIDDTTVEAGETFGWSAVSSDTDITSYTHRIISATNSVPLPTLTPSGARATGVAPTTLSGTTLTIGSKATDSGGLTGSELTRTITILPSSRRVKSGASMLPVVSKVQI